MIDVFRGEHAFLSNFFQRNGANITLEHLFQAAKADTLSDARAVMLATTPGRAKRAGRKVTLRRDWDGVKFGVMLLLLRDKFAMPGMADMLLATDTEPLIEGNNWHDNTWGICACPNCGRGKNVLGRLLEQVRSELRGEIPVRQMTRRAHKIVNDVTREAERLGLTM